MKRSALGYNFYVNPFSSHAADVFVHFAYIISATIVERSIGGRTQSIIGRGYKELELSQVNSCDTG